MNRDSVDNVLADEVYKLTYIVRASRVLTDGEMFSAIRIALLKGGGKRPQQGETMLITTFGKDASPNWLLKARSSIIPALPVQDLPVPTDESAPALAV